MRGRPVLGAISGLLFGLFGALTLQQFGIYPLTTMAVVGFPLMGMALGLGLAAWAPIGRRRGPAMSSTSTNGRFGQ